jgi:phosphate transport system substrate-binding protein
MKFKQLIILAVGMLAVSGLAFSQNELVGAGATFPFPLYSKMFDVYGKEYGVKVNYQAIGSGGGIQQLKSKTVEFGGSDAIMSDDDLKAAPAPILHIPIVAGAVVVTYNLPNSPEVQFTPEVVADIFLGKITRWDDPRIASANASARLPKLPITVVHRSDGSGTTSVFTDYLSKVSEGWKQKVGKGTSVSWPAGVGAKGNPGIAGLVKQLPGSIGYVELIYALQNNLPYGAIRNKAGKYIKPSLASTTAACAVAIPDDTRVSLTDTDAPDGYPIATFTWLLVYREQSYDNRAQGKADVLVKMLWWMTHEGQKYAEPLQYSALPAPVVQKAEKLIRSITFNGMPVMK